MELGGTAAAAIIAPGDFALEYPIPLAPNLQVILGHHAVASVLLPGFLFLRLSQLMMFTHVQHPLCLCHHNLSRLLLSLVKFYDHSVLARVKIWSNIVCIQYVHGCQTVMELHAQAISCAHAASGTYIVRPCGHCRRT